MGNSLNRAARRSLFRAVAVGAGLLGLLSACHWQWGGNDAGRSAGPALTSNSPPAAPFGASLAATSVTVAAGGRAGVWVTLTRSTDFHGDVTLTLDSPPAGVFAYDHVAPDPAGQVLFTVQLNADVTPGTTASLVIAASGGGQTVRLPLSLTVGSSMPSSEGLIAADLAAGHIDYPTSLLYRAYAIFHDARLPAQYAGSPVPRNDGFFRAASHAQLPADVAALLAPFLARPTDATSVFQPGAAAAASTSSRSFAKTAVRAPSAPCVLADGQLELNGWKSVAVPSGSGTGLRLWVACSDATSDGKRYDDIVLTLGQAVAGALVGPMTGLMGSPVGDLGAPYGGPDTAIDVYLVDACTPGLLPGGRQGDLCSSSDQASSIDGATISTSPMNGGTCSDFILVDRNELGTIAFNSTLAHELFHALQDAHNCNIATEDFWFTEASATWAEAHFVPAAAATEVHYRFTNTFQPSTQPLNSANEDHTYAAYIWPYFFEQHFGASTMATAWAALAGATGADQATQALSDGVYNFKSNFRDFAVENLNKTLPSVLTDSTRYKALDRGGSTFPDTTPSIGTFELSSATTVTSDVNLEPLRASYDRYPVTSSKIKKVVFKFQNLVARDGLDIDALEKIAGQNWKAARWDQSSEVKFCLDKPDEDLTDIYLVFSNHNIHAGQKVSGAYKVEASDVPCGQKWTGTATAVFGPTINASVTFTLDTEHSTPTLAVFTGSGSVTFTFPNCSVSPNTIDIQPGSTGLSIDYSTTPPTYRATGSSSWLATYTCGDGAPSQAGAGGIWLADPTQSPPDATGQLGVDNDGNRTISGSASGGGFTFSWNFTEQ
jgi:hypothetical protein